MPYPRDPSERRALVDLLTSAWPHVPGAIERAGAWDADWFEMSTPFARLAGPRAISVVGVIEVPLVLAGREVRVAGVHGVCTHPTHRGRGLFRDAMEEALAWIDARFETAILWTEEPAIYGRFGFREAREHLFATGARGSIPEAARRLEPEDDRDRALLTDRLRRRAPLSARLATRDPGAHTLLDLALLGPDAPALVHLPELDTIVAITERDATLRIDDVIAPALPDLDVILAALPPVGEGAPVTLAFSADALTARALEPIPHPATDVLMVRGSWPIEPPFALSAIVRC